MSNLAASAASAASVSSAVASVTCRACGAPSGDVPLMARELMFGTRETFEYRQCPTCGSLTQVSIPADMGRHYPPTYYSNSARQEIVQDSWWRRPFVRMLTAKPLFGRTVRGRRHATRFAEMPHEVNQVRGLVADAGLRSFGDRVLDVGCGAEPVRLAALRKAGFTDLAGAEPFLPRSTRWQGIPVHKAFLEDVPGRFRLIMFHHSLEHVPDPIATLRHARSHMEADGRLLIRTPIVGGYLWDTFGTCWAELDAPRHTVLFSQDGIARLAAQTGFEVVSTTWESGAWELIASEQYQQDIGMYEASSWFTDHANGDFEARMPDLVALAKELNATGRAGRSATWLRPI